MFCPRLIADARQRNVNDILTMEQRDPRTRYLQTHGGTATRGTHQAGATRKFPDSFHIRGKTLSLISCPLHSNLANTRFSHFSRYARCGEALHRAPQIYRRGLCISLPRGFHSWNSAMAHRSSIRETGHSAVLARWNTPRTFSIIPRR